MKKLLRGVRRWLTVAETKTPSRIPDPTAVTIIIMAHSNRTRIAVDIYGDPCGYGEILRNALDYIEADLHTQTAGIEASQLLEDSSDVPA